jgi:hypothetical protein
VLWHYAIEQVGAGLATVLGNTALQLAGAACILGGLVTATVGRRQVPVPEPELAG